MIYCTIRGEGLVKKVAGRELLNTYPGSLVSYLEERAILVKKKEKVVIDERTSKVKQEEIDSSD